jgi:hypothetical protein
MDMERRPKGMVGWLMAHGWGGPQDVADLRILISFFVLVCALVIGGVLLYAVSPANIR